MSASCNAPATPGCDLCYDEQKRLRKQGIEVENKAHGLFEEGQEVPFGGYRLHLNTAALKTKELMDNPLVNVIYQATVHTEKYLCRADILVRDKGGNGWHLYEVKGVNSQKPEHLADICFQAEVFEQAGVPILSYNLIHLNKNYRLDEQKGLDLNELFIIKDLTAKVREKKHEFTGKMAEAHTVLTGADEPHPKILHRNFNPELPPLLEEYYWNGIPDFSIYNIGFIRKKELEQLIDTGILLIKDVPEDFFKQSYKNTQVRLTKSEGREIAAEELKAVLATYQYPLYFLDYETVNPAIPLFNGCRPYQKICFQYSLDVLRAPEAQLEPGAGLEHFEYLHQEPGNPMPALLQKLRGEIGSEGTVFVWNQTFEKTCNKEMARDYPEHSDFLLNVNDRVRDLMDIFANDIYVDWRFKGKCSVKVVLPVLIPDKTYDALGIQHGNAAMDAWFELREGVGRAADGAGRAQLIRDMLEYCGQDTMAMVKILEFLRKV